MGTLSVSSPLQVRAYCPFMKLNFEPAKQRNDYRLGIESKYIDELKGKD